MNWTLDWYIFSGILHGKDDNLVIPHLYLRTSRLILKFSRSSFETMADDEPSDCSNH